MALTGVSLAWGLFRLVAGLAFAQSGAGVIELVNQVGSAFYGPILAVFVLAAAGGMALLLLVLPWG